MRSLINRLEDAESRSPSELLVKIFRDDEMQIVTAKRWYNELLPVGWFAEFGVVGGKKASDMAYILDGIMIQEYMMRGMSHAEAVEHLSAAADGSLVKLEEERQELRKARSKLLQNETFLHF